MDSIYKYPDLNEIEVHPDFVRVQPTMKLTKVYEEVE